MKDKKEIYLDLSKLGRSDIDKVYSFLKNKGENVSPYCNNRELAWSTYVDSWNDFRESYKKEISLDDFYKLFKRPILFAYFSDMDTLNEWLDEDKIEIISLTFEMEMGRHLIYYKEKAS